MTAGAGRTAADALRLDWARDLRWAVAGDPWCPATWAGGAPAGAEAGPQALPGLARARAELRQAWGLPDGPLVLGILDDAPLLGTLGNLHVAAGAIALGRQLARTLGRPVPVALVLVGGPEPRARPLYALGRDGEVRRVAAAAGAADGPSARRAALALLGALEAITGRPWPEARSALDAACRGGAPAPDLWKVWTLRLWREVTAASGATVHHATLPPLAGAVGALGLALVLGRTVLLADVHEGARRLAAVGLTVPDSPESVFEMRLPAGTDGQPASLGAGDAEPRPLARLAALAAGSPAGVRPSRSGTLLLLQALLRPSGTVAGDDDVARLLMLAPAIRRIVGALPAIRPRPRWTLVSPAEAAFARGQGAPIDLGPEALRQARDRAFARTGGGRLDEALQGLRSGVAERLVHLQRQADAELPRASGVVRRRAEALLRGVDLLIADVCSRRRSEDRARARAWRHLLAVLYPFGTHQDEWLAAYPWAAGGCSALLERLAAEVPGPGRQWLRWPEAAARAPAPAEQRPAQAAGTG